MKGWPIPAGVGGCLDTLRRTGHAAYPVGGCVRDLLLGRTPGDWDVCTDARPERVMELFPRTVPTGLKHGTVTVRTEDGPVETVMVTVLPLSALVPAEGLVLMTLPFSTLGEEDCVTLTSKPALWSVLVALDWDSPTTLGTETCSAPCERR